jgi:hypothetical protein
MVLRFVDGFGTSFDPKRHISTKWVWRASRWVHGGLGM